MYRTALMTIVLTLFATAAQAHDDRSRPLLGAGIGAAVGAAIGNEIGGRNEAIIGSAIGGAVGAAIATRNRQERYDRYDRYRRVERYGDYDRPIDHRHARRYHNDRRWVSPHGGSFCPPGQARKGRCW